MSYEQDQKIELNESIDEREYDVFEIIGLFWKKKLTIIIITSFFAVGSVILALSIKNVYKSEAVLSMSTSTSDSSMMSSLSGLASIAGINIPDSNQDKTNLVIETIKSRAFLKHLILNHNILPSLMAVESYDSDTKQLIFNKKIYDVTREKWVRTPSKGQPVEPTYLEAHEVYSNQLSIKKNKVTGFLDISMDHLSPYFASELIQIVIKEANELLRQQDLKESTDAINFLTTELSKSNILSIKESINLLVQSRLETQMMARISKDYVLKVLEPPFVPEKKFKPKRAIICIVITLLGGMLSLVWIFLKHYVFKGHIRFEFPK